VQSISKRITCTRFHVSIPHDTWSSINTTGVLLLVDQIYLFHLWFLYEIISITFIDPRQKNLVKLKLLFQTLNTISKNFDSNIIPIPPSEASKTYGQQVIFALCNIPHTWASYLLHNVKVFIRKLSPSK
jgi:hypothetical protein